MPTTTAPPSLGGPLPHAARSLRQQPWLSLRPLRRLQFPPLLMTLLVLLVVMLIAIPQAALAIVVGIDIGAQYIKVALVQSGAPMDMVLNPESSRKTEFVLQFTPKMERHFGSPASSNAARYPKSTFFNLKSLLGQTADSRAAQHYSNEFGITIKSDPEDPMRPLRLHIDAHPEPASYSLDVLLAMVFEKIRDMSIKGIKSDAIRKKIIVLDAVINIPPFLDQAERMMIMDAAKAAGINVLRLIHDSSAVAVDYGTSKVKAEKQTIIVYDMGAASSSASLVTIDKRVKSKPMRVKVHMTSYDDSFGGRTVDQIIVDILKRKFIAESASPQETESALQAKSDAGVRLRKEAERVKIVLSASTEAKSFIEHLVDNQTLKFTVTRAELEEELVKYKDAVLRPILDAVNAAKELKTGTRTDAGAESAAPSQKDEKEKAKENPAPADNSAPANATTDASKPDKKDGGDGSEKDDDKEDKDDDASAAAEPIAVIPEKGEIFVDSILLFGGGLRVPLIQSWIDSIKNVNRTSREINGDEAAAMGAALYGATLSPMFRIQKFKVLDTLPYPFQLTLDAAADAVDYAAAKPVKGSWRMGAFTTINLPGDALASKQGNCSLALRSRGGRKIGSLEIENAPTKGKIKSLSVKFRIDENGFVGVRNVTREVETTVLLVSSRLDTENVTFSYTSHVAPLSETQAAGLHAQLKAWSEREREETERAETHNAFESLVYDVHNRLYDEHLEKLTTEKERAAVEATRSELATWLEDSASSATKAQLEEKLDILRLAIKPLWNRVLEWKNLVKQIAQDAKFLNDTEKIDAVYDMDSADTFNVTALKELSAQVKADIAAFKEEERKKREQERIDREKLLAELKKMEEELKKKKAAEAKAAKEAAAAAAAAAAAGSANANVTDTSAAENNSTVNANAEGKDAEGEQPLTGEKESEAKKVEGDDFEPEDYSIPNLEDDVKGAEKEKEPEKSEL